jgi:outer membrane protein OmpA-like peptidoglycan-associated protein
MSTGKKMMLSAAVALAIMAALPAGADEASAAGSSSQGSKQGNIGAVTGIAIGALAGGPVGAVVGAGVGVAVGESLHRQQQSKAALQSELKQSEAQRAQLNASIAQLDTSLSQARERNVLLDQTLQHTDELRLDVSFRTNDDSVMAGAMSPLLKLGALVAAMPQARLRVAGYADPRGSDACNDALSLHRAENVAAVLVAAGVPRERIALEGHGKSESTSEDGDLDAYALDRHVTVQVQLQDVTQVARND